MKACSPTNLPRLWDNLFLTVTENKFIFRIYMFSDPASISLLEFSYNNRRIKCEICSKLTVEATDVVLVSSLLTLTCLMVLCRVRTCKSLCLNLNFTVFQIWI